MTPDFAILFLADCSGMAHLRPWLVLTNSYDGLTSAKAAAVIELLTL